MGTSVSDEATGAWRVRHSHLMQWTFHLPQSIIPSQAKVPRASKQMVKMLEVVWSDTTR